MSQTVSQGPEKEKFARFVGAFTGGKFITKKLLGVRAGKIQAALDAVQGQIDLLRTLGVQDHALDQALGTLRAARAAALALPDDAKRYDALEQVKQKARERVGLAQQKVDQIRQRLANLQQTAIAAWNAIKDAAAVIQQTPDPAEKQRYEQTLADLRTSYTDHSHDDAVPNTVLESTKLAPDIAQLTRVRAEAQQLAADVTVANQILQRRITKLGQINNELGKLRKLNQKVVDVPLQQFVNDKLADLTARREALAQAPLGQLQAELAKVPALLQDISNAVTESEHCGKWGEVKPVREMIRGACNLYITAANKHNKDKLKQDSLALQQKLIDVEAKAFGPPPNPLNAYNKFTYEIYKPGYDDLKDQYYNDILRGSLQTKTDALEQNPHSAEAQMKLALDPPVYQKRTLEAWNTAKAFGSPLTKKLSPGEAVAIYTYTSDDYKKINGLLLKTRDPLSQIEEHQIKIMTDQAKKALAKLDNYNAWPTRRGEAEWPGAEEQYKKDKEFTITAFWSTGAGFSFPGKWQITINGKTGKDVKPISNYPKEAEVLFPPGTKFKVIDRDDTEAPNTIHVTVEEV